MRANRRTGRSPLGRSGAALLEALVALLLVTSVGASAVTIAAQSASAIVALRAAENELQRASALLDAVTLWSRDDLDRHLGDRREGPGGQWTLRVLHPTSTLYTIVLFISAGDGAASRDPRRLLLATAVYRRVAP